MLPQKGTYGRWVKFHYAVSNTIWVWIWNCRTTVHILATQNFSFYNSHVEFVAQTKVISSVSPTYVCTRYDLHERMQNNSSLHSLKVDRLVYFLVKFPLMKALGYFSTKPAKNTTKSHTRCSWILCLPHWPLVLRMLLSPKSHIHA